MSSNYYDRIVSLKTLSTDVISDDSTLRLPSCISFSANFVGSSKLISDISMLVFSIPYEFFLLEDGRILVGLCFKFLTFVWNVL